MQQKWYEPISSISHLNGWRSPEIAVGDSPDARTCRFLFIAKVLHGWPSKDRIIFTNREVFWMSSQTVRGRKAFLFASSQELLHRFRRLRAEDTILSYAEKASKDELESLADLILRTAIPKTVASSVMVRVFPVKTIHQNLPDLSLSEIEDVAALVQWPAAA
jgi:hypothetical protein